jgi:hypothetical protein
MVGRNGIFFDRKGRDWDATITRVVENPISIRQAFWYPYKNLVRVIEEFFAKRAAAGQAESDARFAAAAEAAASADKAAPPPAAPPAAEPPKKIDVGTVAAIGVAVGALGTFLATVLTNVSGFFVLPFWIKCLAILGLILAISGPFMLIAWLKLRQRNLGPILDANGWAVNGRVKMNVRFGRSLTSVAELPPGAIPAADPFGEKRSPWPRILLVALVVGFAVSLLADERVGLLYEWTKPGTRFHGTFGTTFGDRKPTPAEEKAAEEEAKKKQEAAAEAKQLEADAKKAEADAKKAEAEAKKVEADAKKAEADTKKDAEPKEPEKPK